MKCQLSTNKLPCDLSNTIRGEVEHQSMHFSLYDMSLRVVPMTDASDHLTSGKTGGRNSGELKQEEEAMEQASGWTLVSNQQRSIEE